MTQEQGMGAQQADGLSQAEPEVSALRASIPSAWVLGAVLLMAWSAYSWGYNRGLVAGFDRSRDAIMCVGLATIGEAEPSTERYCNDLGVEFSRAQAQAIEARRDETGTGSVEDESAVRQDAPNTSHPHRT